MVLQMMIQVHLQAVPHHLVTQVPVLLVLPVHLVEVLVVLPVVLLVEDLLVEVLVVLPVVVLVEVPQVEVLLVVALQAAVLEGLMSKFIDGAIIIFLEI